jgi:hypothetical protein
LKEVEDDQSAAAAAAAVPFSLGSSRPTVTAAAPSILASEAQEAGVDTDRHQVEEALREEVECEACGKSRFGTFGSGRFCGASCTCRHNRLLPESGPGKKRALKKQSRKETRQQNDASSSSSSSDEDDDDDSSDEDASDSDTSEVSDTSENSENSDGGYTSESDTDDHSEEGHTRTVENKTTGAAATKCRAASSLHEISDSNSFGHGSLKANGGGGGGERGGDVGNGNAASASAANGKPYFQRPKGRPRLGVVWNFELGRYE